MIGCWPDPLPGELLYGTLARLMQRSPPVDRKFTMRELFGDPHVQAVVDLPGNLDHLIANLPSGHAYTADDLIDRHTTLPIYEPFLPAERVAAVRTSMRMQGRGMTIHIMLGLMAGRVPAPRWLRFCPACDRHNLRVHGEPCWQRLHQIAGVEVCPIHKVFLEEDHNAPRFYPRTRHGFVSRCTASVNSKHPGRHLHPLNHFHALLLRLARGTAWLLEHPRSFHPGPSQVREGYVQLLAERGLATHSGRLRLGALCEEFQVHYGTAVLQHLACALPSTGDGWLASLLRSGTKVQNPLRHLLLMDFLSYDPERFFERLQDGIGVFGSPPWPCLNPVCTHRRCDVVVHVVVAHHAERKRPVGEFRCPHCGFTYLRNGPDRSGEHRLQVDAVRDYGPCWRQKLVDLWSGSRCSLRSLARSLDVDPLTAKRWAMSLGLPFPRTVSARPSVRLHSAHRGINKPDRQSAELIARDREAWLTAIKEAPASTTKSLRTQLPALYMRLYRHDKMWLRQHQPTRTYIAKPKARVDWRARDQVLAERVPAAAMYLRSLPGRPAQVSAAALGRRLLALAWLQKHKNKLPDTHAAVTMFVEDREAFAVRRIVWAAKEFRQVDECPPAWRLVRRAGLRPEVASLPSFTARASRFRAAFDRSEVLRCRREPSRLIFDVYA